MTDQNVFAFGTALVVHDCPSCSVLHAIPKDLHDRRLAEGGSVYCPNGHAWVFTRPRVKTLENQLRAAREMLGQAQSRADREADGRQAAERSAAAYRGHATRLRNRVQSGLCPAGCKREFADLGTHMAARHPDFTAEETPDV